MTVSFYGLTIPPDVFSIARESPGDHHPDTLFPIYGNTSAPPDFRYHSYFPPDEKTMNVHFFRLFNGVFHPVLRLFLALKEAMTSSECEA